LKYANVNGIPFVIIVGPDEAAAGKATVKDLGTGKQQTVPVDELANILSR